MIQFHNQEVNKIIARFATALVQISFIPILVVDISKSFRINTTRDEKNN